MLENNARLLPDTTSSAESSNIRLEPKINKLLSASLVAISTARVNGPSTSPGKVSSSEICPFSGISFDTDSFVVVRTSVIRAPCSLSASYLSATEYGIKI